MTEAKKELSLMLDSFRKDMVKRGCGYPKVSIRELPGSHGGYSVSFELPKGAAFFAMAAAMTAFTKLGLQVDKQLPLSLIVVLLFHPHKQQLLPISNHKQLEHFCEGRSPFSFGRYITSRNKLRC